MAAAAARLAERNPGVATLAGVAAHAEGLLRQDLDALRTAVDHLRRSPRPLVRASALEDAAVRRARGAEPGGGGGAARRGAGRGHRLRRQPGRGPAGAAPAYARHATAAARASAAEARSPLAGLTPAALRVARLVAAGRTNRQIADELFISPHTVDSHLRTIYQRLGINSRVELTRIMLEHDGPPPA